MSSSDCLILYLKEYDPEEKESEAKAYVLYDTSTDLYIIRGKWDNDSVPFSFTSYGCNHESVTDFLQLFIGKDNLSETTIYNHTDLPLTSDEITFEYLQENLCSENILVSYKPEPFSKRETNRVVRVLRDLFNLY